MIAVAAGHATGAVICAFAFGVLAGLAWERRHDPHGWADRALVRGETRWRAEQRAAMRTGHVRLFVDTAPTQLFDQDAPGRGRGLAGPHFLPRDGTASGTGSHAPALGKAKPALVRESRITN